MSSAASTHGEEELRLLYLCSRQSFTPQHARSACELIGRQAINWPWLFTCAQHHSVAPLVYHNLLSCGPEVLPAHVDRDFRLDKMQTLACKVERVQALARSLPWFAERGFDLMLLKGAALDATVYRELWYTGSHDYDVLFRMKREGFTPHEHRQIAELLPSNKGIEYDFGVHHDITMNGVYRIDFATIWAGARTVGWQGAPWTVPSPEDSLLMLCINSSRKRFFRLKALCDIAEALDALPRPNWERVLGRAAEWGCLPALYAALRAVGQTVGHNLPESSLAHMGISRGRRRLIDTLALRLTPAAYDTLETGRSVLGRRLGWPLLLSYATLTPGQMVRRLRHIAEGG